MTLNTLLLNYYLSTALLNRITSSLIALGSAAPILTRTNLVNFRWFRDHVAYTMAKYGMSMCVLGMAEEFRGSNLAVNALWPKTGG